MNKLIKVLILSSLFFLVTPSLARNTIHELDFKSAIERGYSEGILDKSIPLYLKGMKRRSYSKIILNTRTNKKTNAFGKSDEEACQWVMLSALKALQAAAKKSGGKAVINIVSNYKNSEYISSTKYQCGAGAIIAGVALKGDIAK